MKGNYENIPFPKPKPKKKHLNCVFYDKNMGWAFEVDDPASGSEQRIGFKDFATKQSAEDAKRVQQTMVDAKKTPYTRQELRQMGFE